MRIPNAAYILPLRWTEDSGLAGLVAYLDRLTEWIEVTVVDGSPQPIFQHHEGAFPGGVRHINPLPLGLNGKAAGVVTGAFDSSASFLVLADDDVRYDEPALRRIVSLLGSADIVRPQNYFLDLPWHARWDTARSLINRARGSDYPGTLAVRREAIVRTGGYDANVLFENLELVRTVRAAGGREVRADDLYVGRTPPTSRQFFRQRIRQAYDGFAQPVRLCAELAVLPVLLLGGGPGIRRRLLVWTAVAAAACGAAEKGRRCHEGRLIFSRFAALWAPLWLLERSVCVWVAVALRLSGGVPYAGARLKRAGNRPAVLLRHHRGKLTGGL